MTTVIPINEHEIAQIIFEYSEDIPNDFYVNIMNLIKKYYEHGNNLQEIHDYIKQNENRIDKNCLINLRKSLKPKVKFYCNFTISCNFDNSEIYNKIKMNFWIAVLVSITITLGGGMCYFIYAGRNAALTSPPPSRN